MSHKFGYGLMDGGGMVALAEKWTTVPPQHICKSQEIAEERYTKSLSFLFCFGTTQIPTMGIKYIYLYMCMCVNVDVYCVKLLR